MRTRAHRSVRIEKKRKSTYPSIITFEVQQPQRTNEKKTYPKTKKRKASLNSIERSIEFIALFLMGAHTASSRSSIHNHFSFTLCVFSYWFFYQMEQKNAAILLCVSCPFAHHFFSGRNCDFCSAL